MPSLLPGATSCIDLVSLPPPTAASSIPFFLPEATDYLDSFLLDHVFQILLTAYLEAHRVLDYSSFRLRPFYLDALVYHAHRFHLIFDPFRCPLHTFASLLNPIGSLPDKLLVSFACLRTASLLDSLLSAPESTISAHLHSVGFSPTIVDNFFCPFLTGVGEPGDVATGVNREEGLGRGAKLGTNDIGGGLEELTVGGDGDERAASGDEEGMVEEVRVVAGEEAEGEWKGEQVPKAWMTCRT